MEKIKLVLRASLLGWRFAAICSEHGRLDGATKLELPALTEIEHSAELRHLQKPTSGFMRDPSSYDVSCLGQGACVLIE